MLEEYRTSNTYLLSFCVSLMCLFLPLRAVLVRFDHLQLPGNKNIYLFFELHDPWTNRDVQQLGHLSRILELRDRLQLPPMHLLVEVPSLLAQERSQGRKVTYDIIDHVTHCPSIAAENIEIRCHSLATCYVLSLSEEQLEQESLSMEQYNAGTAWCRVGDITVEALMKELSAQKEEICSCLDRTMAAQPFYAEKCALINMSENMLRTVLEECHSRGDERIVDLAKRLNSDDGISLIKKFQLRGRISDYGSEIFDLHVLRKMLMSQYNHCMAIAGNAHSKWICNAMEHLGGQCKASEGSLASQLEEKDFKAIQVAMGLPI